MPGQALEPATRGRGRPALQRLWKARRRLGAAAAAAAALVVVTAVIGGALGGPWGAAAGGVCGAAVIAVVVAGLLRQGPARFVRYDQEGSSDVHGKDGPEPRSSERASRPHRGDIAPVRPPAPAPPKVPPPGPPPVAVRSPAGPPSAPPPEPPRGRPAPVSPARAAPVPRQPAHREAGRFPQPLGKSGLAFEGPWHLPLEPGPPGMAADSVQAGDLAVRAASVVGPSHRCQPPGTPRQDAYRLSLDRSGRHLVIAIADGMSDSSHSHLGANVAVQALVQHLWEADEGPDASRRDECFRSAARQMLAAAEQRELAPNAVRAAALAAVVDLEAGPDGGRDAWLASIADVTAWIRADGGWRQAAGDVKQGMDGSHLSVFLPYHPSRAVRRRVRLGPGDVLALTSDGVGDALGRADLGPWFADRWSAPPHIGDFIDTVAFEAKGELDDRTAVVLWCPDVRRRP
ncbi:protein phosphatase 2C domain-containing protein [Actinomadura verrucosospora]|uniref:PPM-type phosphatase domain-containing protein n=1 Tax=Actinomadura verrucosospora TaxID=46165 RepID=A0A7D3VS50_ACTVE|nr:protein phosphatase 2C domain-containing protein [Actinomadura verrucosospora]QKG21695.1 hypothetical protein ACTIVE_3333 [Actinomadura verrucosospora]